MRTMLPALVAAVTMMLITTHAPGQQQTEIYIPIGRSPGISNTATYIGPITKFNAGTGELALESGGRSHVVTVTDDTHIWLDRTKEKLQNQVGQKSDLRVGRTVEVKYSEPAPQMTAEWIKVETVN